MDNLQHAFPYSYLAKPLKSTSFYYFHKENIYLEFTGT